MQRTHIVLLAALIVSLLFFGSCSRSRTDESEESDPAAHEGAVPGAADPEGSESRELPTAEGAVPMRLTDQGRARREPPAVTPADPRDSGFEGGRLTAIAFYPLDTVLGALGGPAGTARDRAALLACRDLLVPLLSGELPTGTLSERLGPGGRAVLDDLIWASDRFTEVRLGLVVPLTEREVSVPFRMMGENREATGEVILERLQDRWYTADVQVDFADRDTTSRFDPGAVRSNPNT